MSGPRECKVVSPVELRWSQYSVVLASQSPFQDTDPLSSDIPTSVGLVDQTRDDQVLDNARKRDWTFPIIGLLVVFIALALNFLTPPRIGTVAVGVGEPAPDIELVRLSFEGDLQFQTQLDPDCVSLVHLWGTWCGPCRQEYPELDAMVRDRRQFGALSFLSVSCESGNETMAGLTTKTQDYLRSIKAETTAYADSNGTTRRSLMKRLRQENIFYPTTVVIDQQGVIRGVWQGYDPDGVNQMRATINSLWAGQ